MNNTLRKKIGLKPLEKSWKQLEIKGIYEDLYVSVNNVIEKAISQDEEGVRYSETDLFIQLNAEGKMITKTGKIKNFTPSVHETIKPNHISLKIKPHEVRIANHSNNLMLMDEYDTDFNALSDAFGFIEDYLDDERSYFLATFENFKSAKKTSRKKIKSGDIFRVPIKNKLFIYGQVISPLRKIIKSDLPVIGGYDTSNLKINVFDPNPFFLPVWIRFYELKTENPLLKGEDFETIKRTKSTIIGDYALRHSNYSIIGNREIDLSELDVPMTFDTSYNYVPEFHFFNWGAGVVTIKPNDALEKLLSESMLHYSNRINGGLNATENKCIEVFVDYSKEQKSIFGSLHSTRDLRDDNLAKLKKTLFKTLGFEDNLDYDEFAKKNGFMSKKEIIEYNR